MSYNPALNALNLNSHGRRQDVGEIQSPLCITNVPSGCSKGLQNMCPETIKRHFVIIIIFLLLWLLPGISLFYLRIYFTYEFILPMTEFLNESFWSASVPV